MKGKLYGVGVGPGDPELITYKAVACMQKSAVIAVPTNGEGKQTAFDIVKEYITTQEIMSCYMPMTRNREQLSASHEACAAQIILELEKGKDVTFLTLGDPTVYSTYMYVHRRVKEKGYDTEIIPGVPSFCAVAARLGDSLCEEGEMLHIIPASYTGIEEALELPGTKVLMKSGKSLQKVLDLLKQKDTPQKVQMVSRCGMPQESVFYTIEDIEGQESYFSVVVVKEEK